MKKLISLLCTCFIIFSCLTFTASAEETVIISNSIEYLEDGSCIETIVFVEKSNYTTYANAVSGGKSIKYKDNNGELKWTATLRATFTYTGSSASCNTANITYSISDNKWKIPSATATKSGNKAVGNVTAKRYLLGVVAETVNKSVTLTCSASGVLS